MAVDEAVSLGVQVADALAAAHAGGVVHRDLKPANLFLLEGGQLKICDFGIAVVAGAASSLTSVSYVVGTPAYMSPEQCDGEEAGEPGDLYSLGCVLYALLTGRPPFAGRPPLAVMAQHRTTMPPGPRALRRAVPAGLDQLVVALLAKDPAARPDSARQVAAALRALPGGPGAAGAEAGRVAEIPDDYGRPHGSAVHDAAPRAARRPASPGAVTSRQLLAAFCDDGTLRVWDPATRQQTAVLSGYRGRVTTACAATSSGRPLLATGGSDGTVRLWDPATGQQVMMEPSRARLVTGVAVTRICPVIVGGRPLLAFQRGDVHLWDPVTWKVTKIQGDINYRGGGEYDTGQSLIGSVIVSPLLILDSGGDRQYFYLARARSWSASPADRSGPEFSDPARGEYHAQRIPLTAEAVEEIDLKPDALAQFLLAHLYEGTDLFALPDLRANQPART